MKKIEDLKKGDVIYDNNNFSQVLWYTYLCVHPTGQGNYHILIDSCEEPFRIYNKKLQSILDKGFNSYQDAKLELADRLEQRALKLRTEKEFK